MSSINWNDPKSMISKYFTVGEATWLPQLKMYYSPTEAEKSNIIDLAMKLDKVRELLNKPMIVTVWIRPVVIKDGKTVDYNVLVGGAKASAHKIGKAVDLQVKGMTAQEVRNTLKDKLKDLGLRMEDGVSWCHFDTKPVNNNNYIFKP